MNDRFLTVVQAAEVLQIDPDMLRLLARKRKVPAAKVGKQWRFDLDVLKEWMREESFAERAGSASRDLTRKNTDRRRRR